VIEFVLFVAGRPAPQGSKRHVGNGVLIESSKALAPWRTLVAWSVAQQWRWPPLLGAVCVKFEFVMPRPKATPKTTPPAVKKPDLDKLERAILDALTGVCWKDDSQVDDMHARKRIAESDEQPGVHIVIAGSDG
jgi:crossover junction endodeoxyribonuclease RusA